MSHDRLPATALPDDEIERIAIEYRYKGGERWDAPVKALTDFDSLNDYDVETDRFKVRLDSGIQDLPHRLLTTTQYDAVQKRLAVIVDTAVYAGMAVMRTEAGFITFKEIANMLLRCDEAGHVLPELREDAFARLAEMRHHPQAAALAMAMMVPLPALVFLEQRHGPLTPARVARLLNVPVRVAEKRLKIRRRWSTEAVQKLMTKRSPVRVETNFHGGMVRQIIRVFEQSVRDGKIRVQKPSDAESATNGTNGLKKE